MAARREPAELTEEERLRLHRAHQHLRNASHALEALTVVEPPGRGRWAATPAPLEALEAAQLDLHEACQEVWRAQHELLSLAPPGGTTAGSQ
ncbi:MAG: hypothetical protein ACRDTT_06385 [Pseudonocardiaceae bacterium]